MKKDGKLITIMLVIAGISSLVAFANSASDQIVVWGMLLSFGIPWLLGSAGA